MKRKEKERQEMVLKFKEIQGTNDSSSSTMIIDRSQGTFFLSFCIIERRGKTIEGLTGKEKKESQGESLERNITCFNLLG